jgi:hypothetical protein
MSKTCDHFTEKGAPPSLLSFVSSKRYLAYFLKVLTDDQCGGRARCLCCQYASHLSVKLSALVKVLPHHAWAGSKALCAQWLF